MKNSIVGISICLLTVFIIFACKSSDKEKEEKKEKSENTIREEKQSEQLCFRNEYPFRDNPSMVDIEELILQINEKTVIGRYNWLPAEKDQRKGELQGTIDNRIINARYIFFQEGKHDTVLIKINIQSEKAVIEGGDPELGLEAEIRKVRCGG